MHSIENIDFITFPTDSFLSSPDYMSNHYKQLKFINGIASCHEETITYYVLGFVLFFYLRIDACAEDLALTIPEELSLSSLPYTDDLFIDIFNRTETICSQNDILSLALGILKPHFMEAASDCSNAIKEYTYSSITSFDWSNNAFAGSVHQMVEKDIYGEAKRRLTRIFSSGNQVVGLYVYDDLIGDVLMGTSCVEDVCDSPPLLSQQIDTYHAPSMTDKILCPSERYMYYLMNLLEKSGWPAGAAGEEMCARLKDVHGYGTNQLMWALRILELQLLGYRQALTGGLAIAQNINEIAETDFDFMILPQLSNEDVPDVGQIELGSLRVDISNPLYCLAYWYTHLTSKGRMHVAVGACRGKAERQVLAHLVDRDEIEAVIQVDQRGSYFVINRQKPSHKAGKVLLYYTSSWYIQNMARFKSCFETFSWDPSETRHSEGALVISVSTIKFNDYLIVPKDYIFDYSTLINNAEFEVVSHLSHNIAPRIASVASIIKHLDTFLHSRGLTSEPLQEIFFEGQPRESVFAAITKAQEDIAHIHRLMQETRKIIAQEIDPNDFVEVDLVKVLKSALTRYAERSFTLVWDLPDSEIAVRLHQTAFLEMLNNIIRNAEVHGFIDPEGNHRVLVSLKADNKDIALEICNNGTPFPEEFTEAAYLSFGRKRKESPGDGLGGAFIDKVLRQHGWTFQLVRKCDGFTSGVRINMPKRRDS